MISRLDPDTTEWLRRVATDPGLSPRDLQVLILVLPELGFDEFRPVKQLWIARQIDKDRSVASRALSHIIRCGYLERRYVAGQGAPCQYRLTCDKDAPSHAA